MSSLYTFNGQIINLLEVNKVNEVVTRKEGGREYYCFIVILGGEQITSELYVSLINVTVARNALLSAIETSLTGVNAAFGDITGDPYDNLNLGTELNSKEDVSNKQDDLTSSDTGERKYPTVEAVNGGLDTTVKLTGDQTIGGIKSFGDSTNNSQFEADGTLKFNGAATVFDDSQVPPHVFRTGGTSLVLAEFISGIYLHRFDVTDVIHFTVQFSHRMKLNSVIYPHIHLANKDTIVGEARPQFTLTWTWANYVSTFPAVTPDTKDFNCDGLAAFTHKYFAFSAITPIAEQGGISSILIGSLARVNTGYTTANLFLLGFDIHFEIDTAGSRQEQIK